MNPITRLRSQGQSVWLDCTARGLPAAGELRRMIDEDGLCGITWRPLDRPHVIIQVPAAKAGIPALEASLAAGIPVEAPMIFSLPQYESAATAFLRGAAPAASIAPVSVSPVDDVIDPMLEAIGTPEALDLHGRIAIANCRLIYAKFRDLCCGAVRLQRLHWFDTGTRNPAYSDVRYVEELIGPDTATTLSPATLAAFRGHGRVRGVTLSEGLDEARDRLRRLFKLGINLAALAEELQRSSSQALSARS